MASIRISIALAFTLGMVGFNMPAAADDTGTRKVDCPATLAQYNEALLSFTPWPTKRAPRRFKTRSTKAT